MVELEIWAYDLMANHLFLIESVIFCSLEKWLPEVWNNYML